MCAYCAKLYTDQTSRGFMPVVTKRLALRFPERLHTDLKAIADRDEKTFTACVLEAVREYIQKDKEKRQPQH